MMVPLLLTLDPHSEVEEAEQVGFSHPHPLGAQEGQLDEEAQGEAETGQVVTHWHLPEQVP